MKRFMQAWKWIPALAVMTALASFLGAGCAKRPTAVTTLPGRAALVSGDLAFFANPEPEPFPKSQPRVQQAIPEELWIVARGDQPEPSQTEETSGSGTLLAQVENQQIPLPLKHTDVHAAISGYIGSVEVVQQFQNPYANKIEAVYVFPLPHNAAVNEFIMTIGDRRIRGIIRERKEAEQIYQQAKSAGYVASLLTQERPNIFTQSVANIEPGREINVTIRYFHTLEYVDGWYEFVFPMVVGPRYNPAGTTNGIGAVFRDAGPSGQKTEVHYLKPGERSGHDIALRVDVDAGVPIEEFDCRTHEVSHEAAAPGHLAVALQPEDSIPNRDFVLRYRVAGDRIKSSLVTSRDERGGYFTLMLFPPRDLQSLAREPLELVFVLDCSGSMSGQPLAQAKAAIARALNLLEPGDSFQIINFSTRASQLGPKPLEAKTGNVRRGLTYLASLNSDGPTEMIEGIKAALDFPHDPNRLRFVCFLTDGFIGNEAEIVGEIHHRLGASRIFSFGIGSSVNRYLLDSMAKAGRGAVAYLGLHDDASVIMEDFFDRISHPGLTDLKIDWGNLQATEIYPRELPDLFVGRPVILTGRFTGDPSSPIEVTGNAAGKSVHIAVMPDPGTNAGSGALPSIWARMKIADVADRSTYLSDTNLAGEIRQVALDYGLMSDFTAFVAVDSTRQTTAPDGGTVPVAVPVPEGVDSKTTVPEQ
jgi:Ca-activated chloride channel family protein